MLQTLGKLRAGVHETFARLFCRLQFGCRSFVEPPPPRPAPSAHCLAHVRCFASACGAVAVFSETVGPAGAESGDLCLGRCGQVLRLPSGVVAQPSWLPLCLGTRFLSRLRIFIRSAVSFPFSVLIVNLILNVLSSCAFLLAPPPAGCAAAGGRPAPALLCPLSSPCFPWPCYSAASAALRFFRSA